MEDSTDMHSLEVAEPADAFLADEVSPPRDPKFLLRLISDNNLSLSTLSSALRPYQDRDRELRDELEVSMRSRGIKTQVAHGFEAQVKTRRDTKIVDSFAVETALEEIGALARCSDYRLNVAEIKKVAKERGEPLPGMEETATDYLSLTPVSNPDYASS